MSITTPNLVKIIVFNLLEESGEDLLSIYDEVKKERLSGKLDETTNSSNQ